MSISDYITPSGDMQAIFYASTPPDFTKASEVALDFFLVTEGDPTIVDNLNLANVELLVSPNPSGDAFNLSYTLNGTMTQPRLEVYDVRGALVKSERVSPVDNTVRFGTDLEAGMYIARITDGASASKGIVIMKQ